MERTAPRRSELLRLARAALFCVGVLLATVVELEAQRVQLSGYYEHTIQMDYTSETGEQLINASKVRLDLSSAPLGGLGFTGNVNLIVYYGATDRDFRPYLPDAIARELEERGVPVEITLDRSRYFLDNAYLFWDTGSFRVRAGLQQLSWGPAYSFNPTDLFHRKNLLDPTYEKEGVGALRVDYRWGIGGELTAVATPAPRLEEMGYALRAGTHLEAAGYDVAVTLHQVMDSTSLDPETLEPRTQRRRAAGVEASGGLLGLGVWVEGNYNWMDEEPDFLRVVVGADYTFGDGTYVMGETLYNGRSDPRNPYPVHDWLANVYYGEPVGSWWMLAGVRWDLSALVAGSAYLFSSPDGSFVLNPRLDVSLAQNADLVTYGGFTFGHGDGAFPPGLGALVVRATVYF